MWENKDKWDKWDRWENWDKWESWDNALHKCKMSNNVD